MSGLAVLALVLTVSGVGVAVNRSRQGVRVSVQVAAPESVPPPLVAPPPSGPEVSGEPQAPPQPRAQAKPVDPPAGDEALPTGSVALIDVAVATLWREPGQARPIDEPSLTNPVDVPRWIAAMGVDDKRWLVGRLATQALYGDRVTTVETSGDWTRVVVTDQPSSLDSRGYPGWLPTRQLAPAGTVTETGRFALVTVPVTQLRDTASPALPGLELTYGTRLPVLAADGPGVTVATPDGRGVLAASDVALTDGITGGPTATDLIDDARAFAGLSYLWGGTSGFGFDCSGLVWALFRAHGMVVPRDADDQAGAGTVVAPADLRSGDLLFYASGPGQDTIHHVAMYVGDGTMIQSPATGRAVETVAVDTSEFSPEFWGARRLLT